MKKIENFTFKNFEDRHQDTLIEFYWDETFMGFREKWDEKEEYLKYTVKIFENFCENNYSTEDFLEECSDIYEIDYNLNSSVTLKKEPFEKIASIIENLRNEASWNRIKGHFVENIVNFIFIKRFSMKYYIEPEVLYNNEILVYRNEDVEQKNFDILAHKKLELFILGEVKTSLATCVNRYDLKRKYKDQVKKIDDIENHLVSSRKNSIIIPKVLKYYIVLNTIPYINIPSLQDYRIIQLRELINIDFYESIS
ncbi:hypothetical protein BUY46_11900 [Staphylococcus devriesei]|nr:hypothetical protein BUY46_11900 [Staphylococcus devriesei]